VVDKPPQDVSTADVLAFITAQRLGAAQAGLAVVGEDAGVSSRRVARRLSIASVTQPWDRSSRAYGPRSNSLLWEPHSPAASVALINWHDRWLWPTLHRLNMQLRVWAKCTGGSHAPSRPTPPATDEASFTCS
jgi:hypothetical protein